MILILIQLLLFYSHRVLFLTAFHCLVVPILFIGCTFPFIIFGMIFQIVRALRGHPTRFLSTPINWYSPFSLFPFLEYLPSSWFLSCCFTIYRGSTHWNFCFCFNVDGWLVSYGIKYLTILPFFIESQIFGTLDSY